MKYRLTKGDHQGRIVEGERSRCGRTNMPIIEYESDGIRLGVPLDWCEPVKAKALSQRKQAVKRLIDDGYKPSEVAKILAIPRGRVCQIAMELRRMEAA